MPFEVNQSQDVTQPPQENTTSREGLSFASGQAIASLSHFEEATFRPNHYIASYLSGTVHNFDDSRVSESPIYYAFFENGGTASIMSTTIFSSQEFFCLWVNLSAHIYTNWNVGGGRPSMHKPKDVLFMKLAKFKHAGHLRGS